MSIELGHSPREIDALSGCCTQMDLVLLERAVLDDPAQPLDHLHPVQNRADRKALHGLPNQIRDVREQLPEGRIGIRATQLPIEVHHAIRRVLRESAKFPHPSVGMGFLVLTLTDIARYDQSQRLARMIDHLYDRLDRNDTGVSREQGGFGRVVLTDVPAIGCRDSLRSHIRIRGTDVGHSCRHELLAGITEDPASGLVHIAEAQLAIKDVHQVIDLLDDQGAGYVHL